MSRVMQTHPAPPQSDAAFARALLDPGHAPPPAIVGMQAERRFGIYRNNVILSLIDALAVRFPVVRACVGDDFFHETARIYARTHPPRSPLMAEFGDDFASFLATFPPVAELPYLPDIARLEAAITSAFHAPDAPSLCSSALAGLPAERLLEMPVAVHPAVRCLVSRHPCVTILEMNHGVRPLGPIDGLTAEDALVTRPAFEVRVTRLPPGGAQFLAQMVNGAGLADALETALQVPGADLPQILLTLLSAGALVVREPVSLEPN